MPRGGARRGAGRPPGPSVHAGSQAAQLRLVQEAADDGMLPLKVMLDNIRLYTKQADELIAELLGAGVPPAEVSGTPGEGLLCQGDNSPGEDDTGEASDPNAAVIEAIGQVLGLRKLAGQEAERAAPYCHSRMGVLGGEEGGTAEIEVPLAERLKEYTRRDAIDAAAGKVVELKAK